MKVELTTGWPWEKIASYGPEITAAMKKLEARFPREVTVQQLYKDIQDGKRQLWLIMEDDGRFLSFVLTNIQTNEGTGLKTLVIPSLAGDEGEGAVPLIAELEKWGKSQGCGESLVYGRYGWKRSLAKEGYDMHMAVFRKPLE